jgi:hypothetical protein
MNRCTQSGRVAPSGKIVGAGDDRLNERGSERGATLTPNFNMREVNAK